MDLKVILGAIIFVTWFALVAYFLPIIASLSALIAALVTGVYVGRGKKTHDAINKGAMAGLMGGVLNGILGIYVNSVAGIPLTVPTIEFILPYVVSTTLLYSPLALAIIGVVYGAIGGFLGSIKHLKFVFLFFTLIGLFLLYGAIDNVVWNWGTPGWTWNMSVTHVLTNNIDISVAIGFALFITVAAYFFRIVKD